MKRNTTMRNSFTHNAGRPNRDLWPTALCLLLLGLLLPGAAGGGAPVQAQAVLPSAESRPAMHASPVPLPRAGEICKAALQASGGAATHDAWRLKGAAKLHGADQTFEMEFDSRFRFQRMVVGAVPEMVLFDGSNCWTDGPAGKPHRIILHSRDEECLFAWTLTGAWAKRS